MSLRRIAVFCGSNPGVDPIFRAAAESLGAELLARQMSLVYGGGNVGLMGIIADVVMAGGGEVIGVIPQALRDREVAHEGITRLEVVADMHIRKQRMYELSDALIALPGGIGTFEELFESLTWIQLGLHAKPCGVLNIGGYYDPLLAQLDNATQQGFLRTAHRQILTSAADPRQLLDGFADYQAPDVEKWIHPSDT